MPPAEVRIKGQRELERAFLEMRREVLTELKPALVALAEPIRADAQSRAGADISNIGPTWQRMRLGVTVKGAYVAPRSRQSGNAAGRRQNLAGLLMEQMQGALDAHQEKVVAGVSSLIDVAAARNGIL